MPDLSIVAMRFGPTVNGQGRREVARATATSAVSAAVDLGTTGALSPPDDVEALARNISRLLGDEGMRRALGRNGRTRVLEHFGPDRLAADMERLYRRVLAN